MWNQLQDVHVQTIFIPYYIPLYSQYSIFMVHHGVSYIYLYIYTYQENLSIPYKHWYKVYISKWYKHWYPNMFMHMYIYICDYMRVYHSLHLKCYSAPSSWAPKPPTSAAAPPRARPLPGLPGHGTTWRPLFDLSGLKQLGRVGGWGWLPGLEDFGRWVWKCWESSMFRRLWMRENVRTLRLPKNWGAVRRNMAVQEGDVCWLLPFLSRLIQRLIEAVTAHFATCI